MTNFDRCRKKFGKRREKICLRPKGHKYDHNVRPTQWDLIEIYVHNRIPKQKRKW